MSIDTSLRRELITRIVQIADQKLEPAEAKQFRLFLEQVIHVHPEENLFKQSDENCFGAFYGLYQFGLERQHGETKIHVFNPDTDKEGWGSERTLIYFCQQDVPFLVDSLRMALNRKRIDIHLMQSNPVILTRNTKGLINDFEPGDKQSAVREDFGLIFVDQLLDTEERTALQAELNRVLEHVNAVVSDFKPMLDKVSDEIERLKKTAETRVEQEEVAFLEWLRDGNFTFLGVAEFDFSDNKKGTASEERSADRLGLMRLREPLAPALMSELSPGFSEFLKQDENLAFTKSTQRSIVHRGVYSDYVIVKRRDEKGRPVGEIRFLGLYTSRLYNLSIQQIPLVRRKAEWIIKHSQLDGSSHNGKTLISIMEGHPRDELIQDSERDLLDTLLEIWKIYERKTVRLFIRSDPYEKFASCIVYIPRESLRTRLRESIEERLAKALNATESEFTTQFLAESVLARIHIVFHITDGCYQKIDIAALEAELAEIVKDWDSRLQERIQDHWEGDSGRRMARRFAGAFPAAYQEQTSIEEAVDDLQHIASLSDETELAISFFRDDSDPADIVRLKLFRRDANLELSDLIPMLENLGFRVLVEHPHRICAEDGTLIWMLDFRLRFVLDLRGNLDLDAVRGNFINAFLAIWHAQSESDSFNRMVLGARLDWRSVVLLRTYARYLKQIGVQASQEFIADVLSRHLDITRNLIALFRARFDPRLVGSANEKQTAVHSRESRAERLREKVLESLDDVANLNEDQVLRTYLEVIEATQRTNFFQLDSAGQSKSWLSIKIATQMLEQAPEPRPAYEVFVYSPRMEGVHLRNGKVARGGIRWSDRLEDYRTEILGLVKAQQVKNAVIVPLGAKGGFVVKNPPAERDAWVAEGQECYRTLIRGMLDITDNVVGREVRHPDQVVCRDGDDPYLVVAADKGTATFSDIANQISDEYGHWMGDAFASGGSQGYDHKKMGITARGGWVAVQRHFRELGLNVDKDEFSVIGIGDMSGDVFGNAMLLSKKIRLVAAFNHQHIFIDPEPDSERSWKERKRLFELPRSSWSDYDESLISAGGGIFERSAKSISISNEMQACFQIEEKQLAPAELISRLLKAPVDLIWNGGIGTYVKSEDESNSEVGDRANDYLRVNGKDLRCRVFGEGGNLGITQLGRIEYAQRGGICNTDFIDNSAGVDCSDNEVNIKILLNTLVKKGKLETSARNDMLEDMEGDVSAMVLRNNYDQTLAISLARQRRDKDHHLYLRFMEYLESEGYLKRSLENLPDEETLAERVAKDIHWTRPELSVLVSYAKVVLKETLAEQQVGSESWTNEYLNAAFPQQLVEKYVKPLAKHRLKNEIVATQLANRMVDRMGFTYVYRMQDSVGASASEVARAFTLTMNIFEFEKLWAEIEKLDYQIAAETQHDLWQQIMRLGRRSTRWYLRHRRKQEPARVATQVQKGFEALNGNLYDLMPAGWQAIVDDASKDYQETGVPSSLADSVAVLDVKFLLPGIVTLAQEVDKDVQQVAALRLGLSGLLSTYWLMQMLIEWNPLNRWQDFARESHVDDLESMMRRLTFAILKKYEGESAEDILLQWQEEEHHLIERFQTMVDSLKSSSQDDLSVFTVTMRELKGLVDATFSREDD